MLPAGRGLAIARTSRAVRRRSRHRSAHRPCQHHRAAVLHAVRFPRLPDAGLAPPAAFDHRRLEQGTFELGHLRLRPWRSGCVRSGRHGTPCVRRFVRISRRWRSRRPEASGIALTICSTLSRTMASSFVSNMASSNCMISLDMASASFQSRFSSVSD